MKGQYEITVRNNRIRYRFTIHRNITILKGDSATGKTTLIEMIQQYLTAGESSGVTLVCKRPCVVLTAYNWQQTLAGIENSIVFIDEGSDFPASDEFARMVRESSNYYVIVTRRSLPNLPYSITEVYGIRNTAGNRYQGTKRLYSSFYPLYTSNINLADRIRPQAVIVEDSHAGYEFFSSYFARFDIPCISAGSNSNIYGLASQSDCSSLLIIADGAAFGPEIERVLSLRHLRSIILYMPESFEWLILKSDVLRSSATRDMLEDPGQYIESADYFSWERFFTDWLIEASSDIRYLKYSKSALNPGYLQKETMDQIMSTAPGLIEE